MWFLFKDAVISGSVDTGLILAGGESARFGRPKALADVAGKPMVSHVVEALESVTTEIVMSVGDERTAEALRPVVPRATFAVDRRPSTGPVEGMIRGFQIAHGARVLVAPCDAPLLRPDLYRLLLRVLGRRDAAVPKIDVIDPVRAVYRRSPVLHVLATARRPFPSPSSIVDALDVVQVEERHIRSVDPRLDSFVDVNREEDLSEVLARLTSA